MQTEKTNPDAQSNMQAAGQMIDSEDPKTSAQVGLRALEILAQMLPAQAFQQILGNSVDSAKQNTTNGPQPGTDSPEGLGAMMAQGHPDSMKLYGKMKGKLPLNQMDKVEGGVLGRVFSDSMAQGKLDPAKVRSGLNGLAPEAKSELWGNKPDALDKVLKFADCMARLQKCFDRATNPAAKQIAGYLTLSHNGPVIQAAGKAVIPWRFLTNPLVSTRLTAIADRSDAAASKYYKSDGKSDRGEMVKTIQKNQEDVKAIMSVVTADHSRQSMSLVS